MYCKLLYAYECVFFLKTLVLYIYRLRGIIQYSQQLYAIHSSYIVSELSFFLDP
jgi:hypothetical protein